MVKRNYKIVVSGAATVNHCCDCVEEITKDLGRQVAEHGCVLVTGATTGVPYYAALGCSEAGGFNIGFSPAATENSHLKTYKLPVKPFDLMIYTGADYVGRNVIMTKCADGVIVVCGRMGTVHEFTTAFETKKPLAVLEGTGGFADKARFISDVPCRGVKNIIYEKDPHKIVERLIALIDKEKKLNGEVKLGQ
ncbi:MAG: hypothetical protein WC397_03415 [Candidatus Paceibacterota bacterium]|jgi:hypothetical protein